MNPFLTRVLEIAGREVGVREVGRNRGERVEMYQAAANLLPGDPWCAAFVSYCVREASRELHIICPMHLSGSALKILGRADSSQIRKEPEPGAIFIIDHGGGLGRTGFVETIEDGYLVTIEGNTNDSGGREGDGVYRRRRGTAAINRGYVVLSPSLGPVPEEEIS